MTLSGLPVQLRLTLRSGTVYYFEHRGLKSTEPHYFVVINAVPQSSSVLVMAVGSSQVAKVQERRKDMPPETLVVVDPAEYQDFPKQTIIDCNQVFERAMEELVQKFNTRQIRNHQDLPEHILKKIWQGVQKSPRVDQAHKNQIPSVSSVPPVS